MTNEEGFRMVMDRQLLAQVGKVEVDYLTGPFRRGFQIRTANQAGGCC